MKIIFSKSTRLKKIILAPLIVPLLCSGLLFLFLSAQNTAYHMLTPVVEERLYHHIIRDAVYADYEWAQHNNQTNEELSDELNERYTYVTMKNSKIENDIDSYKYTFFKMYFYKNGQEYFSIINGIGPFFRLHNFKDEK